jgi:sugar phosphate isomerase/epimerase
VSYRKVTTLKSSILQVWLGVSPLSWTNDVLEGLEGDIPLETCLQEAADIGYEGIELGRKFPRNAQELVPKLLCYSLQLAAGWYSGFLATGRWKRNGQWATEPRPVVAKV